MASHLSDWIPRSARDRPDRDPPSEQAEARPAPGPGPAAEDIRRIAETLRDPLRGPRQCGHLADELLRLADRLAVPQACARPVPAEMQRAYASLSPREREIFSALAEGRSVGEVAAALNRSPKTVNNHRTHIMKKLGLRNSAELARLAFRLGISRI